MSTNKKGLLSICCLGYNHSKFITQNIEAIWKSDYKSIEIIVVDDGSKDNSAEILKNLATKSPFPMTLILQENTGNIGKNFNTALKKATGEFIAFMSLDDILFSDKIKCCLDRLKNNPCLAFVAPSQIETIDNNSEICNAVPLLKIDSMNNSTITDLLELEYSDFGAFYIQGVFFRKKIIDAVSGFDEDMLGDDIVLRTKVFLYMKEHTEYGYEIIKEPTCYYRRHNDNISSNGVRQIRIVTQYLQRYWSERPNPKILVSWVICVISQMSFRDALKIFSLNSRAALLLEDDTIQSVLINKIKKETSLLKYIYWKEKQGNKRIVTLFSFIKIVYHKKKAV